MPICHDIERAVAEIEWLADKPGIGGIMVPTMWRDHTPYNHPSYDPVWAACQAANFPVHTHSGEAPREEMNEFIGIYLAEVVFWTHRPISHLLFSGAFERFPGLKFVVTEGACYWVADMKWKWDQYLGGGHTTKKMAALMKGILSKLPSEYFGTNIFVGASTMSKEEIRRRHTIGCDVAMWGTDYPHPEGTWPNTIERLRKRLRRRARRRHAPTARRDRGRAATASTSKRCARSPSASAPRPTISARTRASSRRPRRSAGPSGGRTSTTWRGAAEPAARVTRP